MTRYMPRICNQCKRTVFVKGSGPPEYGVPWFCSGCRSVLRDNANRLKAAWDPMSGPRDVEEIKDADST